MTIGYGQDLEVSGSILTAPNIRIPPTYCCSMVQRPYKDSTEVRCRSGGRGHVSVPLQSLPLLQFMTLCVSYMNSLSLGVLDSSVGVETVLAS